MIEQICRITNSGKNTLHDTVGIIFQNIDPDESNGEELSNIFQADNENDVNVSACSAPQTSRKRRRTFSAISPELPFYSKKLKLCERLLPVNAESRFSVPDNLKSVQHLYLAWMVSYFLKITDMPMWVGFNSLIYKDECPTQKVSYLTTINSSPTNISVVLHTMLEGQRVAEECGEEYQKSQIMYDLAIAKIALQLQSTENPNFNNLFIHIGSFHIMMAYFKANTYIDNCGLINIMVDCEMIANGSVNEYLTGKHFNRCKRLHPIVSLALQILHFQSFVNKEMLK